MKTVALIYCLILPLCGTLGASERICMDEFSERYKKASAEMDRLNLCIEAINHRVIDRGVSVRVIDKLFSKEFFKRKPTRVGAIEVGVVNFGPSISSNSDLISSAESGWYFAFEFDCDGCITNYYLSNLHK